MEKCLAVATTAGNSIAVKTAACTFFGAIVDGSAGGATLTILDSSGGDIIVPLFHASTASPQSIVLTAPIACTSGLFVSCSGTGSYTIFYGDK